jgi:hypothetical protein
MDENLLFDTFFLAGFECACQRRRDGRRLDLLAATGHDLLAGRDYARLRPAGIGGARDGIRWYQVDRGGRYDFGELVPRLAAARQNGVRVIWDLCHYGWPDDLDVWSAEFLRRFARFARAAAAVVAAETAGPAWYAPVNEISFWAWAGGEVGYLNPFGIGRGRELKAQLARASLAAIEAIRRVDPGARFLQAEPLIHIVADPARPGDAPAAARLNEAQYEAVEMLAGRTAPELGGAEEALDVVGVNFYPANQWLLDGTKVWRGHAWYRPLRELLAEAYERYRRPLLISETGAEGEGRAEWVAYVCREVRAALRLGVPVEGICLYPVLDYLGWDDDRHCPVGLWGFPDERGERPVHRPLLEVLAVWGPLLARERAAGAAESPARELSRARA